MATNHLVCCERLDESKYRHKCACPSATFDCESSGKDAELCGNGEFTGDGVVVSVPPKKYRLHTQLYPTNSSTQWQCCQPDFTSPFERQLWLKHTVTSGATITIEYDPSTCNVTHNTIPGERTRDFYQRCDGVVTDTSVDEFDDICGGSNNIETVVSTISKTQTCSFSEIFGATPEECEGQQELSASGSGTTALTDEDTETDALDRETPTIGTSCSSTWQVRSTGFEFTKRTSGYTIECDDLVIGYEYEVTPAIRKRTVVLPSSNFGAWEDVVVTPVSFTATAKTETIDDGGNPIELDNIQGFEYEITGVNIEKKA